MTTDFENPQGTLPWTAAVDACADPVDASPTTEADGGALPATGDGGLGPWAVAAAAVGAVVHLARRRPTDSEVR